LLDLIIGRRELGKTTLAVSISHHFSTRVIFDPRHMIETTSDVIYEEEVALILYELLDTRAEVIVRPRFDVRGTFDMMCKEIHRWLHDNPGEPFFLLVDENRFLGNPEDSPEFSYIVRCTPREQVTVALTCHGVTDVSTDLRRVADYWILFHLTLEADLDRVRERCGETVALAVQQLNPYEYIVWNDAVAQWKKHAEPSAWYVDLKSAARMPVI
jgi:hypothetical protein